MSDSTSQEKKDFDEISKKVDRLAVSDPLGGMFPKTKANKIGFGIFLGLISAFFLGITIWINVPKDRPESEPLPPNVHEMISRLPGKTNILMYVGMSNVRQSDFWNEVLPDSVKQSSFLSDSSALQNFANLTDIQLTRDIDTLLYSAISNGAPDDSFLSILSGRFNRAKIMAHLDTISTNARQYDSLLIHRLEPKLWFSLQDSSTIILANTADQIEDYFSNTNDFFGTNPKMVHLLDVTQYKTDLWMALGNAGWASGAMGGLTASNRELKNMGNIKQIKQLVLSLKLKNGIQGQTEWVYESRTSTFFASGLLWLALRVSGSKGTRLKNVEKEILNSIEMEQNLESIILRGSFSNNLIKQFRSKNEEY